MFGQIGVYKHQLDWDGLGLVNYQSSPGLPFNSSHWCEISINLPDHMREVIISAMNFITWEVTPLLNMAGC